MELDAEGGANFDQLQELIKKNVTNVINTTVRWNKNTTNSMNHLNNPSKKTRLRGAKEAPQTKISHPQPRLEKPNRNAAGLPQIVERNHKDLDNITHNKEKPTIPPMSSQTNTEEAPRGACARDQNRRKNFLYRSEQAAPTVRNKLKQQF